ncbi:nucleoid-associated protein [Teredinibacter purpureus]|uniref:nucleoid-associated protein n=1 Tax=Teredinibacter purpureus TaxID=2731756 RepID=UPI0005F832EC|nr:nucleoid-associated protein [Teredinibacter purpureus]
MPLTHFIAHRVQRLSPTEPSHVHCRESVFTLNGKIEEVFRELKQSYLKRLGKQYGRFSEDIGQFPLSSWLRELNEEKIDFARFSELLLKQLKTVFDSGEFALEGHFFIAQEQLEVGSGLYCFWVHQNQVSALDGELNFNDLVMLDTANIAWGVKINLDDWENAHSQHYLGVIAWRGEKEISDALLDVIGFTDKIDTKADTEQFLEAVEQYVEKLPEDEIPVTRNKIVEYCLEQDKRGQAVALTDLSEHMNQTAPKEFQEKMNVFNPEIKQQFIPDRGQVKNYVRISGRDELISMSFASGCLGETVVYDAETDSLTIRKIPSALKSRLMKHMRDA